MTVSFCTVCSDELNMVIPAHDPSSNESKGEAIPVVSLPGLYVLHILKIERLQLSLSSFIRRSVSFALSCRSSGKPVPFSRKGVEEG